LTAAELDEASLLCAIVDMHVALTEPRAYKAAIGDAEAFNLMAARHAGGIDAHFLRRYRELILDHTAEAAAA
jgi:HD-GYP domain-containing protein (c-di-GMP phosphodiesterase class II)